MASLDPLIQNLPRRVLVYMSSAFVGIVILVGTNVYADSQKTKAVAYQAKGIAEDAQKTASDLKEAIQEIKDNATSFTDKYDRNQEENQRVFRQILAAVKT